MNKPIRVRMKIDESDILRLGEHTAFSRALEIWNELPWIQFLREHGELVNVSQLKQFETYENIYIFQWQLPEELTT